MGLSCFPSSFHTILIPDLKRRADATPDYESHSGRASLIVLAEPTALDAVRWSRKLERLQVESNTREMIN